MRTALDILLVAICASMVRSGADWVARLSLVSSSTLDGIARKWQALDLRGRALSVIGFDQTKDGVDGL